MKYNIYFIFSLILFSIKISAQYKAENLSQLQLDNILNSYKSAKKIDSMAILARDASINYYKKKEYDIAIKYALIEVNIGKKVLPNLIYKKSIYNLGRFYYLNNNYSKSIKNFKKVVDSFETDKRTYQAYCEIGRGYDKLGAFYQAINYFKKGLSKQDVFSKTTLFKNYNNLTTIYSKIDTKSSKKEELILLKKMDSLLKKVEPDYSRIQLLNNAYANYYNSEVTFNYNKSKHYYLQTLDNAIQFNDSSRINTVCTNLGNLYNKQKNDSALYFLEKGIKYGKPKESLYLYLNISDFYTNTNQFEKANKYLHKILQQTSISKIDSSYNFLPTINSLTKMINKPLLIITLKEKAKNFLKLHEVSNNIENAKLALENIILADQLITISRQNSFENQSKLIWQTEASELYMLAVKACYLINKPEQAFYFIEKNKALLLLDNISENKIDTKSNMPLDILQQEQDFKKEISRIENELSSNYSKVLEVKYHDLKIDFNNFTETLKLKHTEYYKKPVELITIDYVTKELDEKTTILEYILNEDDGFILAITKDSTELIELAEIEKLNPKISDYLKLLHKPLNNNKDFENYTKTSNILYKKLLPFKDKTLLKNKLLIIPDYTLQNLPFESLKHNNKYLIENYEISYAYSLSFLKTNKDLKRNAKNTFIGFAPYSFKYNNLQILPRSKTETKTIANNLNGKSLLNEVANKDNFFSEINNYKIIHLSTHANANDSIAPWIAFKDQKLYLNELYTTKNQAELVVLNACNSSLGQINAGEGVFSLARGFFYSGANSVVSSLWNVNDKSNAEITTSFYSYLKEGKTKSTALRQAKLDYLNTHSLSETSPYYWSALILIGDDSAINLTNNTLLYSLLFFLLLIILIFIIKKTKIMGNKS